MEPTWKPPPDTCPKKKLCVQPYFIGAGPGAAVRTGRNFAAWKAVADEVWCKCCVRFDFQEPIYLNNIGFLTLRSGTAADDLEIKNLFTTTTKEDCIEVYFVHSFGVLDPRSRPGLQIFRGIPGVTIRPGDTLASLKDARVIISDSLVRRDTVLAHELGHILGITLHRDDKQNVMTSGAKNNGSKKVFEVQCAIAYNWNPLLKKTEEECMKTPDPMV